MSSSEAALDAARIDALDPDLERNDLLAIGYRRLTGRFEIDEFGYDRDLVHLLTPLAARRWRVQAEGDQHIPELGAALLVHNRRLGWSESAALAVAVARATGRPLRWSGAPRRGPWARGARQVGGVPSDRADLRSLLRAGELVTVPLDPEPIHRFHVPAVPLMPMEVALELGVPVVAVALRGLDPLGRWSVRVGVPISTRRRRATTEPAELAEATRLALRDLLNRSRRSGLTGPDSGP